MTIDPSQSTPTDVYKLLVGAIVPRPIAFVSTISSLGQPNLAPYSFFTVASVDPPIVLFTPTRRARGPEPKDSLRNVQETGEFVINIVSEDFVPQMNSTSAEVGPDVNEFELAGLTPIPSEVVRPPRVAESRVHLECKLVQIVTVSDRPLGGSLVLGEIVRLHIADEVMRNGSIDPDLLRPVGRMGGPTYSRVTDRFDLIRP